MHPRLSGNAALLLLGMSLQACSLAPTYSTPVTVLPDHYREQAQSGLWQPAHPEDQQHPQWWRVYNDTQLDSLQEQLLKANPDLTAAVAHFDAAQAYASQLHAGFFPRLDATAQPMRQRQSDRRPLRGVTQSPIYNSSAVGLALNFDLDFWGRIHNQVAAGDALAQASADDLAAARLSLQRQLAMLYAQIRGLDAQRKILVDSLDDYTQALQLTRDRYQGQIASELDLTRAQSQLAQAQAQLDDVQAQRNLNEHAIAELVGALPSDFRLTPTLPVLPLPAPPNALPSTLLQRRPDIAAAERRVFAANANVGVAKAAYYPDFSLTGLIGGQTAGSGNLLAAANRYWALGPLLNLSIFDAGRRSAHERQAKAEFEEAAAHYHSQVLKAVREVEDNLAQIRDLKQEATDEQVALDAAKNAERIAMSSYEAGAVSYLDVVAAQSSVLQAQLRLQVLETDQRQTNIALAVALGGGWQNHY